MAEIDQIVVDPRKIARVDAALRSVEDKLINDFSESESRTLAHRNGDIYFIWGVELLEDGFSTSAILPVTVDIFKSAMEGRYGVKVDEMLAQSGGLKRLPLTESQCLTVGCFFMVTQEYWFLRRLNG